MTVVSGRNRVNRPYFFVDVEGNRAEFPSFGTGIADLEGNELNKFNMYVRAKQIDLISVNAPVNLTLPTIEGTSQVGETLTGAHGTWSGNPTPTLAFQWQADGEDIEDATEETYLIQEGDVGKVITLVDTATNEAGTASAISEGTEPVEAEEP